MNIRLPGLLLLLLLFALQGCRTSAPIQTFSYNLPNDTLHQTKSRQIMRQAIIKACVQCGWNPSELSKEHIQASITVKNKHTAVVDITYSADHYEITYASSVQLKYRITDNGPRIHSRYNAWVNKLSQAIQHNLNTRALELSR